MNDTNLIIFVTPKTLSDGSKVYDVELRHLLALHAVSETDATALAEKIQAAVDAHTVSTAKVVYA